MAISKRKIWFYSATSCLNLAVLVMFVVVNIPLATFAAPAITKYQPPPQKKITEGIPIHITIPSVSIDLPVKIGSYNATIDAWSTDTADAFYADYSLPVNDHAGTTLIYSHARWGLFGDLPDITPQAVATVVTDNGFTFHYAYQSVRQVIPSDTSVFVTDGPPTLVLQTCAGDWSQYRDLYSFQLVSVEKS